MPTVLQGPSRGQFEQDLLKHAPMMRSVLRRDGVAEKDAEDVLQDAMLVAWQLLIAGAQPPNVGTFLAKIAHNKARYRRAKARLDRERYEQQPLPGLDVAVDDAGAERRAAAREQLAVIESMRPTDRRLLAAAAVGERSENHPGLQHARERLRKLVRVA